MDYAVRFAPESIKDSTSLQSMQTEEATMPEQVKVAKVSDIPMGGSHLVEVDDVRVALFNLDGEIYAIEDVCTHDGGPLVDGAVVNGCQVECPRHGARFDIRTGDAVRFPAFEATTTYAVRVDGDDVWLERP